MEAVKFLVKLLAAVPKSPPNTRNKYRDVHDPRQRVDVLYKHSGTPQSKRTEKHSHQIEDLKIAYSTSIDKKQVPESKIPKPTGDKST